MRLRVSHRTSYAYPEPVATAHHELRLAPRHGGRQFVVAHDLALTPRPAFRRERTDSFGNRVVYFGLHEPHESLSIVAASLVEVTASDLPPPGQPSWEEVRDRVARERTHDVLAAYALVFDSPYVSVSPELTAYAAPSFAAGRPLVDAVLELCARIHADFRYDPRATTVSTPLADVMRDRRGVCQDFSHVAIGCLRAFGLPARYVSGYLLTRPPPDKPKLVGADASHAWVSTYLPDWGWIDLDPTNEVVPSDAHVTVAHGRDFGDVTPVRGVILGGGKHDLAVSVDVGEVGGS
jgi:transglutaminase-like putative cysteine protease